jgi:metal-sulfur cluster biosynthetic enzyme
MICDDRIQEVWRALDTVTDPEIDESVTSLEFITDVRIGTDADVRIEFRLPTYWCAPNFAFLMASDMRDAVSELPWVKKVSVELLDHFSAALINRSIALKRDFREAFPGETDGDLADLRKTFLGKAFERRQELLMAYLLVQHYLPEELIHLQLSGLIKLALAPEGIGLRNLYLFARRKVLPNYGPDTPAFTTLEGAALEVSHFPKHLRRIRGVRMNAEFNGAICRGLLATRKGEDPVQELLPVPLASRLST